MNLLPGISLLADGSANVVLWAPYAQKVALAPVNGQAIPLEKKERGYWQLQTREIKPNDTYWFTVDDQKLPDPASRFQSEGVHGPSCFIDLNSFKRTAGDWENHPLEQYLIYELHTGTFSVGGDFAGIIDKLPHLKSLGVNAIEIMPVAQFPGERNWGYDGVFPYAVQNSYGGPEGLMALVDACHQNGIAVVLDVVYNHIGPEGNYFPQFGPYFTDKYHTPWGNAVNFDDAGCDEVRNYFIQNALMWFRDFRIDALRLDAVHAIKDFSPVHFLRELKQRVDELMQETGRTHYLIVESDLNDTRFIEPLADKGFGMDAQWIDEFHHALRVSAGGERNGYYADFNGIVHLAKAYDCAYVYDGIYSPERQKTFGTKTTGRPGSQFIVFSQNHDHVGNRMLGERSSTLFSFEMQKLMAATLMVSPFIPMLFMGEEWSETNPFLYFVSHTDEDLIAAVRKGRKEEFKAFHAQGEAPDPQAEDTFLKSKLNWDNVDNDQHHVMLKYYKSLIALRKQLPALHQLNRDNLKVTYNEEKQTLQLHRWHNDQHVFCLMNFSSEQRALHLFADESELKQIFNSAATEWNGPGSVATDGRVTIQPQAIIIYTNNHV